MPLEVELSRVSQSRAAPTAHALARSLGKLMPLDPERAHLLARRNAAAVAAEPHLAELRRRLLACGGDEAVLQTRDPDSPALVARGEPRGVRGVQARRTQLAGPPSDCHRNAVTHFLRDPRRRRIMTGYYLVARDPVWRQHSWVEEEAEGGCPPKLDTLFADLLALERCTDADYDRATDAIASGAKTEAELMSEWAPMGLEIGTVVKIKNLKSRPELNGCEAKVIDFRITNKRYDIQLSGGKGEKIAVKPENIQEVGGKDAASAASAASTSTLVEVTNYSAGADTAYFGVPVEGREILRFVLNSQPHEHSEGLTGLVAELPPEQRALALAKLSPRLRKPVAEGLAALEGQPGGGGELDPNDLDAVGKKGSALEEKLRQIAELKELKAGGKPLEKNQLDMIEQEPAIKEELASLMAAVMVNLELSLNSCGVDGAKLVEEALPWLLGTAPMPPSLAARREENDKLRAALAGEQVLLHGLVAKPELNQRMGTAAGWDSAQYSIHTCELLAVAPVAPVAIGFREGQAVEVIVGGEWRPGRIYDENEAEGTYDVALQGGKYRTWRG